MYKNYFFLSRFVEEANEELLGLTLNSVFSQEKDKLILAFTGNDLQEDEKFIEISVNHGFPYIAIRKKYSRAKKNTISFFEEFLPSSVITFSIKKYDRVIQIECTAFSLFFMIRGKFTNLVLLANGKLIYFKSSDDGNDEGLLQEFSKAEFTGMYEYPDFTFDSLDDLKKKYPFIGKEIMLELKGRNEYSTPIDLVNLLEEIKTARPSVFFYNELGEYEVLFENFTHRPVHEITCFDSTGEAFYYYISHRFNLDDIKEKKNRVLKHVNKQLEKISAKLNNLNNLISAGSKEENYNQAGNLLLINIHSLKAGMSKVALHNIYTDREEVIKLDPAMHPRKNIDNYFDKARNEKIRIQKGTELKLKLEKEYYRLREVINKLENINTKEEISAVMKDLKMRENENVSDNEEVKYNFKQYLIEGKYFLFVGRDSRNNDELTTRFAKQNDYWFHARGLPGSHVVLRNDNPKEIIPKNIIKKAASIAAFHSKGKTAGLMPVSYCQKKYVVKKKGMEAGKVALLKEEVVLVKPEIPSGCEYIEK